MGSGAARHGPERKKGRRSVQSSRHAAGWDSTQTTPSVFQSASRPQPWQNWQSSVDKEPSFTLSQEARNTHRSVWSESSKLRDNAIKFVSGGTLGLDKEDEDRKEEVTETGNTTPASETRQGAASLETDAILNREPDAQTMGQARGAQNTNSTQADISITGRLKQINLSAGGRGSSSTRRRSNSGTSTSSDEVILFAGRGNPPKKGKDSSLLPSVSLSTAETHQQSVAIKTRSPEAHAARAGSELRPDAKEFVPMPSLKTPKHHPQVSRGSVPFSGERGKSRGTASHAEHQRRKRTNRVVGQMLAEDGENNDDEDAIQDYIENMLHLDGTTDSEEEEDDDENQWKDPPSSSNDSEEDALDDLLRDLDSEDAENERILNHTSQMSDAELARILNKQAELGLDTDDVVLFDGLGQQEEYDFVPFSAKTHISNRTRSKTSRRSNGTFPSAEAFADVLTEDPYNGFDVMDFNRPSLKPKRKGRKSASGLPFELEDPELAEQLAQSWADDRTKKAARRAKRDELRQAGLLGAKSERKRRAALDLQTSSHQGSSIAMTMDMEQVKAEVRLFLMDDGREALRLVAMASPQRAQVHLLARALHLTSHSQGKGENRFPVLTKTAFSGRYDQDNISEIDALLAQRRFSQPSWSRKDKGANRLDRRGGRRGGGGGGVATGASYMDGEVVGASAPELGSDNRGRAMLEKMGWSSGMGIGKVGNMGSVEVIKHVVKNTKAGLG